MNHRHRTAYCGTVLLSFQSEKRKLRKGDNYHQQSPHGRGIVYRARSNPRRTFVGNWYPRYLQMRPQDSDDKRRAFLASRRTSSLTLEAVVCAAPSTTGTYNILPTYHRPQGCVTGGPEIEGGG